MEDGPDDDVDLLTQARIALQQAEDAKQAGLHAIGADAAQGAAELARQAGDAALEASALRLLCLHRFRLGDSEAAVAAGQRALPLLAPEELAERSELLCAMTMALNELGLHSDALAQVMLALDAARATKVPRLVCWALNRTGVTYEHLGEHEEAERFLLQALQMARQIDGDEEKFSALNNLCSLLNEVGRAAIERDDAQLAQRSAERGLQFGEEALALATASGNTHRRAIAHGNLSTTFTLLHRHEEALAQIDASRHLAHLYGYRLLLLSSTIDRAHVLRDQGDVQAAIELYRSALAEADEVDNSIAVLGLRRSLYECFKSIGDCAAALAHHEALLQLERRQMKQRADTRTRLLLNRLDMELMRTEAERARLDAEVQRLRTHELEREMHQLAEQAQELNKRVLEDQLTGLANRRRVDEELPRQLARSRERPEPMCIAAIDLDHFKSINDRHGHAVGDDVLRGVARMLSDNTRAGDLVARIGGEEFLVLFGGTPLQVAAEVCERLRNAIASFDWSALTQELPVTISVGVCDAGGALDVRSAIERADSALYAAKRAGRNRVQVA
jgi:diguanylate cyclase (GGDEF)-like protein